MNNKDPSEDREGNRNTLLLCVIVGLGWGRWGDIGIPSSLHACLALFDVYMISPVEK